MRWTNDPAEPYGSQERPLVSWAACVSGSGRAGRYAACYWFGMRERGRGSLDLVVMAGGAPDGCRVGLQIGSEH